MRMGTLALCLIMICAFGAYGCGGDEDGESTESGPLEREGMVLIGPSVFVMGAPDGEGREREKPMHGVSFEQPYYIDKYEVTVGEFAEFLQENGNICSFMGVDYACYDCGDSPDLVQDQKISCDGAWQVKSICERTRGGDFDGDCSDHPATLVFYPGARAYCEWKGKRLPSEAEWERAANGPGGDGSTWLRFPWGSDCPVEFTGPLLPAQCASMAWTPSTAKANCEEAFCNDGWIGSAPVGSFPTGVSPEGVHDMAGNAMEWVEDCFHDQYAYDSGIIAPANGSVWESDCDDLLRRVARGGSFVDDGGNLRGAFRGGDRLTEPEADPDVGFRCASD